MIEIVFQEVVLGKIMKICILDRLEITNRGLANGNWHFFPSLYLVYPWSTIGGLSMNLKTLGRARDQRNKYKLTNYSQSHSHPKKPIGCQT